MTKNKIPSKFYLVNGVLSKPTNYQTRMWLVVNLLKTGLTMN